VEAGMNSSRYLLELTFLTGVAMACAERLR
jgi:hypothetical protein